MISTWRSGVRILAALIVVTLFASPSALAQPVLLHPPSGPDRPIVIAVLADNFEANEEIDFNEAAKNFFVYGILADAFYQQHASGFTVKTLFRSGKNYGFVPGRKAGSNCSVSWDNGTTTASALEPDAAKAAATHIVVIGNYHYNFGCKHDNWIYIAKGAVGQKVLHHEFGHLIGGLFDEYGPAATTNRAALPPRIMRANCASVLPVPHWAGVPNLGAFPGCALYPSVYHAFEHCRMGTHGPEFCAICKREMDAEFKCLAESEGNPEKCGSLRLQPQMSRATGPALGRVKSPFVNADLLTAGFGIERLFQPSPSALLRMLVRVRPNGDVKNPPLTILSAIDSSGRYVPRLRRLGDYVYEVTETLPSKQTVTLALGVLPSDPFEVREYAGGLNEHRRTETATATFLIPIPDITRGALLSATRSVAVAVYRLNSEVGNEPITPALFAGLKAKNAAVAVAQLSPADLREQLKGIPNP